MTMFDLMKLTGGLLFPSPVVMALLTSAAANRQFAKDTSTFFSTKLPSLRLQRTTKGSLVASGRGRMLFKSTDVLADAENFLGYLCFDGCAKRKLNH